MSDEKIEIKKTTNSFYFEQNKKRTYLMKNGKPTIFLKKNPEFINEIKKIDPTINASNIKIIEKPKDIYNGIFKSPKGNNFYLETPHGKLYLYRNGKFTNKLFDWKNKTEKEDYIEAIEDYLGGKIKATFTVYVFAKQDEKIQGVYYETDPSNSNFRVIRKYNITGLITKTKANQLITEFKADSSSLPKANKIQDYKWLLNMLANTTTYDHFTAIKSLIEYIKVTDFQTMDSNKNFDLKTASLKNQEKYTEPKINHEFIEYSAKTIKDLQNHDLNEYLLNNFQSESCVYTTLIKLYNTHFELSYQALYNYFHQQDLNEAGITCDAIGNFYILDSTNKNKCIYQTKNSTTTAYFKKLGKKKQGEFKKIIEEKINDTTPRDYSLSVEQLKKFFVEYNLKMTILDIHGNVVDKHHPTSFKDGEEKNSERTRISVRHFKGLVSNNHLYQITNRLETIQTTKQMDIEEISKEIRTSENYYIRKNKFVEEFLTNVEELLSYPFEENKYYKFFTAIKLDDLLHWFKEKIKYHPNVQMTDQITKIAIKINKSDVIFVPFNAGLSDEVAESSEVAKTEYMKLFVKQGKEFEDALINKRYISIYEESLIKNLLEFPVNAPIGSFVREKPNSNVFKLDFTKAYSSVLYKSKFIPAVTPFDGFKEYYFESIVDHHIYIISLSEKDNLFSNQEKRIIFGVNLKKIKNYKDFTITHVCALNKYISNEVIPNAIDKVKNSALNTIDWKFILNKTIGLTGKKYNQGKISYLFDDKDEANLDYSENFPKEINIKNENSETIKNTTTAKYKAKEFNYKMDYIYFKL